MSVSRRMRSAQHPSIPNLKRFAVQHARARTARLPPRHWRRTMDHARPEPPRPCWPADVRTGARCLTGCLVGSALFSAAAATPGRLPQLLPPGPRPLPDPPGRHATLLISDHTRARPYRAHYSARTPLHSFPFRSRPRLAVPVAVAVRRLGLPLPLAARPARCLLLRLLSSTALSCLSHGPIRWHGSYLPLTRSSGEEDLLQWTWCRRGVPPAEQPWRRSRRYAI